MRTGRTVATLAMVAVVAFGGLAYAGYNGVGPLASRLGVIVTELPPQAVRGFGDGGDPLVISVLFPWAGEGFCSGQFSVSAIETDQEVRVSTVTSREYRGALCAGLGTADGMAGVELRLARPMGQRRVVRASDGTPIPVSAAQ